MAAAARVGTASAGLAEAEDGRPDGRGAPGRVVAEVGTGEVRDAGRAPALGGAGFDVGARDGGSEGALGVVWERFVAAAGEAARVPEGLAGDGREPPGRVAGPRPLDRMAVGRVVDGPAARAVVRPREAEVLEAGPAA